jgi:hypothetical protein
VLGLIDAGLGRKEEALREGRRAVELLPAEKDAVFGPLMVEYLAMIAAWVGDNALACEQLDIAIRHTNSVSYGQLKLLPSWDPLRGDPRFEKIVASLAPKDQETMKTAGVSQNEAGERRATWTGSPKGELAGASEIKRPVIRSSD